ncbi:hypothetical protein F4677DRAFT_440006 [Hypoxylon crocopeplum]|nr:hypothetical protein F4677DRAFT_440006 [Hypoxylon crocopeplum]
MPLQMIRTAVEALRSLFRHNDSGKGRHHQTEYYQFLNVILASTAMKGISLAVYSVTLAIFLSSVDSVTHSYFWWLSLAFLLVLSGFVVYREYDHLYRSRREVHMRIRTLPWVHLLLAFMVCITAFKLDAILRILGVTLLVVLLPSVYDCALCIFGSIYLERLEKRYLRIQHRQQSSSPTQSVSESEDECENTPLARLWASQRQFTVESHPDYVESEETVDDIDRGYTATSTAGTSAVASTSSATSPTDAPAIHIVNSEDPITVAVASASDDDAAETTPLLMSHESQSLRESSDPDFHPGLAWHIGTSRIGSWKELLHIMPQLTVLFATVTMPVSFALVKWEPEVDWERELGWEREHGAKVVFLLSSLLIPLSSVACMLAWKLVILRRADLGRKVLRRVHLHLLFAIWALINSVSLFLGFIFSFVVVLTHFVGDTPKPVGALFMLGWFMIAVSSYGALGVVQGYFVDWR